VTLTEAARPTSVVPSSGASGVSLLPGFVGALRLILAGVWLIARDGWIDQMRVRL